MKIEIELPDWAVERLKEEWANFDRSLLEAVVIEGYRTRAISNSDMRELLGFDVTSIQEFLSEREIPHPGTPEDDERALAALRPKY